MSDSQGSAAAQADVTIVIPSLNQGAFLEQALASIFAQDIAVDVRLMDAGSTDCTRQIIERWSARLSRWRSAPDHGQAWAINEGLRGARSRFVTWLNADDCYVPGGLRSLVQGLDARPGAAFAYGQARLIEEDGTPRGSYHVEPWNVDRFARRCFVSQPAALIRRECWKRSAGWTRRCTWHWTTTCGGGSPRSRRRCSSTAPWPRSASTTTPRRCAGR